MNERERHDVTLPPLPDVGGGPTPRLLTKAPFRWLVIAEGLTGIAMWGYFVAAFGDAAYRFEATSGQMGMLLASFSIVFIPAAPGFGTLADRWSPRWMLIIAALGSLGALVLAYVASSMLWLYLSVGTIGLTQGVVMPSRGALVPRLVGVTQLVRANGMIGAARELSMVLGPAIGGASVALGGRRAPYLVAGAAVGIALLFYHLVPDRRVGERHETSFLRDLARGVRVGLRVPVLRVLFAMGAAVMFLIGILQSLEPIFVKEVLERGQGALGLVWSVHGTGAFLASMILIRLRRAAGAEMAIIAVGLMLGGMGFIGYAASDVFAVAVAGTFVLGMGFVLFFTTGQALIQRISTAPGKVTSVFVVITEIGPLISALLVAALGRVSVQPWLVVSGAAFLAIGLVGMWVIRQPSLLAEEAPALP